MKEERQEITDRKIIMIASQQKIISLRSVAMTKEVMQDLEKRKLIMRLAPGAHDLEVDEGDTLCATLYQPVDGYGSHKIMTVTVNRLSLIEFGTHPDNEDFYMIGGGNDRKPLYLVIALCFQEELEEKVRAGSVSSKDFITLKVRYNDPEVSFFTMLKNVPHGEAVGKGEGKPASFYVTESRDMVDVITNMGDYELLIQE